jgi:chromosomal replication initiator protein
MDEIWNDVKRSSKEFLAQGLDIWLNSCLPISIDDKVLIINVANPFVKVSVENKLIDPLQNFLRSRGYAERVEINIDETETRQERDRARAIVHARPQRSGNRLNPKYVFDAFVVGKSNRMAHAASLAVSESPGFAYNPLFIWGGVGLGKTHLMHAIAHHVEHNLQGARTLYVSSEKFTNDLINAIRFQTTTEFRAQYRDLDVLLVDDIQFISGKDSTQEEFFNTFNSLHGANKQIVISSDCPPKEIRGVEERLVSRFEWGLVSDIQKPDLETRVAILQKKAEQRRDEMKGCEIHEDVILFLAQHISSNIRELEGALSRVILYSNNNSEPLNSENIGIWFNDILMRDTAKNKMNIGHIQQVTAEHYKITLEELLSLKKTAKLAEARQVAMYLSRKTLNATYHNIGLAFGKDHTTVMYACEKIEKMMNEDFSVSTNVDNIMNKLNKRPQ